MKKQTTKKAIKEAVEKCPYRDECNKTQMKIIPFRIKASEEEDNYSEVYSFLIRGSSKDAYETEIDIDNLNDLGITETRCTCADYYYRQNICKHIKFCISILKEFQIETESKQIANRGEDG